MKFFAKTDLGKTRQVNQDYYIAENRKVGVFPNLFIVADGVGSNRDSAFASKHCSSFVLDQISLSKPGSNIKDELEKAYRLANTDLVYRIMANPKYKGMGTTMVCTTIVNDTAIVANVGDSRCYHISNEIKQVTRDHSIAEELVKENAIERNSEKYKELKSQLSRAFGAGKKIETDFFEVDLRMGDYLLLCTDGLSNMVDDETILEIVNRDTTIESKVDELIDTANKNGGKDNIAIILIYIDTIDKENLIFEKDKNKAYEEAVRQLEVGNKKTDIKTILDNRTSLLNDNFRSRSRRRKDGGDNE
ncbi:MAG: Stp1/IreP family PP2C-type Ser/Thr phosphatase [Lachnospiraceae bacterium]|nr:Stp1/IreP family PP2C-type Ser/Thr phosphatase [Lachnospiraceae bacterium]